MDDDVEDRLRRTLHSKELNISPASSVQLPPHRKPSRAMLAIAASIAGVAVIAGSVALTTRGGTAKESSLATAASVSPSAAAPAESPTPTSPETTYVSPTATASPTEDPNLALTEDCGPARQSMNGNVLDYLCASGKTSRSAYTLLKPLAPHLFSLSSSSNAHDARVAVCADIRAGGTNSIELSALGAASEMFGWHFRSQVLDSQGLPDC